MNELIIYKQNKFNDTTHYYAYNSAENSLRSFSDTDLSHFGVDIGSEQALYTYKFWSGDNGGLEHFPTPLSAHEQETFDIGFKKGRDTIVELFKSIDASYLQKIQNHQAFSAEKASGLPDFRELPKSGIYLKLKQKTVTQGMANVYYTPDFDVIFVEDGSTKLSRLAMTVLPPELDNMPRPQDGEAKCIMKFEASDDSFKSHHIDLVSALIKTQQMFYAHRTSKGDMLAVHFESMEKLLEFLKEQKLNYFSKFLENAVTV